MMKVRNFGQTPAFNIKIWQCLAIRKFVVDKDYEILEPTNLENWVWKRDWTGRTLPPGELINVNDVHFCDDQKLRPPILTPDERDAVFANTKAIFLYGEITYENAFGKRHFTKFRMYANRQFGLGEGTFVLATEGNEAN
jgi:hypothetical protein